LIDPSHPPAREQQKSGSFFWRASWEKRKRLLRIEAWVFLACTYLVIIFAYAWPQDYRNQSVMYVGAAWTATIVRTFEFHAGLLAVVVAMLAGVARFWRLVGAAMPLVLFTVGPLVVSYWPWGRVEVGAATPTVMSVNLLMVNRDTDAIISEIEAEQPDVLLLQEYTDHWHAALQARIGERYPHSCHVAREDSFGTAIYSKRPFQSEPELRVPLGQATEPQIRVVIEFDGKPVAFYNVHLLPPWGMAYTIEHRSQFADLLDVLERESMPTIVGGDFNFTENSPNARALERLGFSDAQTVGGLGRGATWPVNSFFRWIPSIRLDHIYISGGLQCGSCKAGVGAGSDHRPVVAKVGFRKTKPRVSRGSTDVGCPAPSRGGSRLRHFSITGGPA